MNFDTFVSSITAVPSSSSAVVITPKNDSRHGLYILNDNPTNTLYLAFGGTASLTSFTVKLSAGSIYEMPTGYFPLTVSGIWDGSTAGNARVTEISKGYF